MHFLIPPSSDLILHVFLLVGTYLLRLMSSHIHLTRWLSNPWGILSYVCQSYLSLLLSTLMETIHRCCIHFKRKRSPATRARFTLQCTPRTLWDILWNCLATTLSATWVPMHSITPCWMKQTSLKRQLFLVLLALDTPDILVLKAFKKWRCAWEIRRTIIRSRPMCSAHYLPFTSKIQYLMIHFLHFQWYWRRGRRLLHTTWRWVACDWRVRRRKTRNGAWIQCPLKTLNSRAGALNRGALFIPTLVTSINQTQWTQSQRALFAPSSGASSHRGHHQLCLRAPRRPCSTNRRFHPQAPAVFAPLRGILYYIWTAKLQVVLWKIAHANLLQWLPPGVFQGEKGRRAHRACALWLRRLHEQVS